MNHQQVIDHEGRMLSQFRQEKKKLAHLCPDWDFMAIHSEMDEIGVCCCDFETEADNILRDERSTEIARKMSDPMRATNMMIEAVRHAEMMEEPQSPSQDFSSVGAPAHSGTDVLESEEEMFRQMMTNPREWHKKIYSLLRGS